MRINNVNSVNQYQQRNQNFGMAFKTKSSFVARLFFKPIAEDDVAVRAVDEALTALTEAQKGNDVTDIVFSLYNYDVPHLNITRRSNGEVLQVIGPDYSLTTLTEQKVKMLADANKAANTHRTIENAIGGIETVEKD